MSTDVPIRILVVDDHPVVRQGIAGLIGSQSDMTLVAEASNGREAIQQFRKHHPDIALMDLQMPEMNGLDALAASQADRCGVCSIVGAQFRKDALDSTLDGFLRN